MPRCRKPLRGPSWRATAAWACAGPCLWLGCAPPPAGPTRPSVATQPHLAVRYVAEMEPVDELEMWPHCKPDAYAKETRRVQAAWQPVAGQLQQLITVERVRQLSRWAQKQMEIYQSVPPVRQAQLVPVAADSPSGRVLFEATIDTLPSHHPNIITRWLKVFVVYDPDADAIEKATVTIRGQILE